MVSGSAELREVSTRGTRVVRFTMLFAVTPGEQGVGGTIGAFVLATIFVLGFIVAYWRAGKK